LHSQNGFNQNVNGSIFKFVSDFSSTLSTWRKNRIAQ
jgi:hypothetical protein